MNLILKKDKLSRNKFNKGVKDLFTENYEILIKQIEDNTNKWEDSPKINVVKMSILLSAISTDTI